MASHTWRAVSAVLVTAALAVPAAAQSLLTPEPVSFEDAVQRAIAANPTVERAATNVQRAEALLAQARAAIRPTADATIGTTTLDGERGFDGNVVQPRTQMLFAGTAAMPVLAMAQWAARTQAARQIDVAKLQVDDVRRQVGVSAAQAYLTIIGAKRQLEVNERARDTAKAQLDYASARREGGVGSRLNEVRAAQELAVNEELVERARLALALNQEALGLLMSAGGPIDSTAEPMLESPEIQDDAWLTDRTDIRLFDARVDAAGRIVDDSWKDWVPTVRAAFNPQYITPAGLFAPSAQWTATLTASIPLFDSGRRRAQKLLREVDLTAARVERREAELQARSAVRSARATIDAEGRALQRSRDAATQAAEVLRITDVAFRAGATTNIELVDAQRRSRDAESAVRQAEDRARIARLALLVAVGRFPQ